MLHLLTLRYIYLWKRGTWQLEKNKFRLSKAPAFVFVDETREWLQHIHSKNSPPIFSRIGYLCILQVFKVHHFSCFCSLNYIYDFKCFLFAHPLATFDQYHVTFFAFFLCIVCKVNFFVIPVLKYNQCCNIVISYTSWLFYATNI